MRVYFFGPSTNNPKLQKAYQEIIKKLSENGFQVISKTESDYTSEIKEEIYQRIQEAGEMALSYVNGIVLETTNADPEIGYLLAFAILQKKPTLCLYQSGRKIKEILGRLGKNVPSFILTKSYQTKDLEKIILEYIALFGFDPGQSEVPNIKFTLRISPKISNYLYFKTHRTKKAKADFLRELIQEIINKDENYKSFLAQRKKK